MNLEDVFLAALDQPDAPSRNQYLERACNGDPAVRRQVDELLAAHFRSGEFLDVPAIEQVRSNPDEANTVTVHAESVPSRDHDTEVSEELSFLAPSLRPDSLGRIGHYEVLQVLGKGGFGIVFRAFDDVLQRVVAVKVMAPQLAATSPARKRFLREARTSAAVRHENVVQVYEVAEHPLPYLAMEFIPGETLQQKLDRNGPLDVAETLRIARQIAEGLAAAHATDLIHRDIKPANVLIEGGSQQRVKITDFGLARAADDASISQSGIIAGTPMYMAPEQALGYKLDQRADLFSLGSVLYQMVSGRAPFRANSTLAVLKRVAEDTPRPIREVIPETPQWLCEIIAKLHAKNPDDRFQSAREVADVLADCEAQLKSNSKLKDFSRIPRTTQPTEARSDRRKWTAASLVLALLCVAGVYALTRPGSQSEVTSPGKPDMVALPSNSDGFVQLFNGKDLTGWKMHDLAPGNWRVEDGSIVGRGDASFLSFLFSESEYADFHLRVEAKINAIGDSGVCFRAPFDVRLHDGRSKVALAGGYEAQIAVRSNFPVHTGSLIWLGEPPLLQQAPLMPHRPDEWVTLEVIARGNHLQTFVNGKKTADYVDDQRRYARGHLALQSWGANITVVRFRKIEIKELPPGASDPAAVDLLALIDPARDTLQGSWNRDGKSLVSRPPLAQLQVPFVPPADYRLTMDLERTTASGPLNFGLIVGGRTACVTLDYKDGLRSGIAGLDGKMLRKGEAVFDGPALGPGRNVVVAEVRGNRIVVRAGATTVIDWEGEPARLTVVPTWNKTDGKRPYLGHAGGGYRFHRLELEPLPPPVAAAPFDAAKEKARQEACAKQFGVPVEYTNSLGMKFRLIPPGTFTMGSSKDEIDRCLKVGDGIYKGDDLGWNRDRIVSEGPAHEVEITKPFYLGTTPVTFGQFRKFVEVEKYAVGSGLWLKPGWDQTDDHPAVAVSMRNANGFCKWLGKADGQEYRLPTEAEWEYACRAGTTTRYWFGDDDGKLPDHAWFKDNSKEQAHPVGNFPANPWGLFDLYGNVWQWCGDLHDPKWYAKSPKNDPVGTGDGYLVRGGAWQSPALACRSAAHNCTSFSHRPDTGYGFRVTLTVDAVRQAVFSDADVKRIAALPAAEQVEEVRKELKRRNPDFDGTLTPTIENEVVTGLAFSTDHVTDITPVRTLTHLRKLRIDGTGSGKGLLADLSPLKGMALTMLDIGQNKVADLTPLRGMPLEHLSMWQWPGSDLTPLQGMPLKILNCGGGRQKLDLAPLAALPLEFLCVNHTQVADLTPLKDVPLTTLLCSDTNVSDLTPLRGMRLKLMQANRTKVSDLSPLKGMPLADLECTGLEVTDLSPLKVLPLVRIICDFQPKRDAEILRAIETLETINGKPAAEFWKDVDKK